MTTQPYAPKAGALPDCATPRRDVSLSGAPFAVASDNVVRGTQRQNTARTDVSSPGIVPEPVMIPAGMVPWNGGDTAPEDWDGGPYLCRDGKMYHMRGYGWAHGTHCWNATADWDRIAYTPRSPQASS